MKTIIIEDEQLAARRLEKMILETDSSIEIVARLESVKESVEWFRNNPHPDLIFLDIHLEDGLSFSIFDQVKVNSPIIFTTAFDEYAIKAFKLKSIDYLLKPIIQDDLAKAITKFRDWGEKKQMVDIQELFSLMKGSEKSYRERFSVVVGQKLKSIDVKDIAYFFSNSGITFVAMQQKGQFSLDISLDNLMAEIDPKKFFRVNRQYIVSLQSIVNIHIFPKSRLKLELNPPVPEGVFVSLDKVVDFKKWVDGSNNA
ncbi:MAG TPA: response regulator transcription factor [Draconibacterium sp.]|nr:response regulator transcription factor [Draconibacterium sp.]